jgi:hypothetical protein
MGEHRKEPTYRTSELGRNSPDAVTPMEDLLVSRVDGSNFYCRTQDGRIILVNRNHLWKHAPYNQKLGRL